MPDENDIIYDTYGINLVGLLEALIRAIGSFFGFGGDPLASGESGFSRFLDSLGVWWEVYSILAIILSLLFFIGFIYAKIRLAQLVEIEQQQFREAETAWAQAYGGVAKENDRWKDVEAHIASENPNDWRLGIIEADIMLEETLEAAGYVGTSIGEKLKTANPESFRTVQDAWDAHKIRNQIAHTGSDFVLTKRIATEALTKYERVFREFGIV